ncbi:Organic hydroperoxide resistance transcriptional regulator [Listeria ivanovii subsp. londoniensis]|uniref:DNA-binding transcriptional regulator, MarR family n=1 Tax=Listeria ivanovii TaxID=1638 RepID=A0AAX2DPS9_LISIV|nr:MarR family transcriptional regulator [Listeria ivanovii]AIS60598.1 MarR family transcriptional regulator [Listeria ivanovii subsp. londoniensis]EFR96085.1 organic hydroperoxide resistance transcriptional regulator [Listeria ivanovii FSL F6-596]AIS63427.1 MarR family transcriptional regulator [Listeria ivanovii subsp. londoniensis]SDW77842.1 DNA-binding transcriptional regulator, MarR family [Listeria ivanovii]VEH47504.1 Organic hydroperoxide resistance transcriptional regulator [Listeria i
MVDTNKRILEEQLCFSVYSASKQFTRLYREALEPFQLTYPQYISLLVLWEGKELMVSELGNRLALDSGTLTPMLKRMEHLGYVTRSRHPEDERRVYIKATEKANKIQAAVLESVDKCLQLLGADEKEYTQLLTKIQALTNQLGGIEHEKTV